MQIQENAKFNIVAISVIRTLQPPSGAETTEKNTNTLPVSLIKTALSAAVEA